MNKSNSPYIMKYVLEMSSLYWIKGFLNLLDWHTASAVKDTFIISTEDIHKNNTWSLKKADTAQLSSNFEKKSE